MTPSYVMSAASIPAPAAPTKQSTQRSAPKDSSELSEPQEKNVSTNKNDDISKDASGFETLMAALLNTPSFTQTHPVANDASFGDNNTAITGDAATSPLVIVPQNTTPTTLAQPTTSGDFSQDLLSALTPGTPSLPAAESDNVLSATVFTNSIVTTTSTINTSSALLTQTVAEPASEPVVMTPATASNTRPAEPSLTPAQQNAGMMTDTVIAPPTDTAAAKVPVPVLPNPASDTAALVSVSESAPAEPLVIATGLTPAQMQGVKDQLTAKPNADKQALTDGTIDVMTVSITPDKDAPVLKMTKPLIDNGVTSADLQASDAAIDPVELRIAQSFQRPVSSTASQAADQPATTLASAATGDGYQGNAAVMDQGNAATKGKVNVPPLASASPAFSGAPSSSLSDTMNVLTTPQANMPMIANPLTSPIIQNPSAAQSMPAVQTVAAVINKAAKEGNSQTINLRLDPPELGKLEIQMKYKKGDPLKVHLVVEKADTAHLFQKDAHVLENALKEAGIQTDGSSLSFEFSQNHSGFDQAMARESASSQPSQGWSGAESSEAEVVESTMDIFTDARTGLTHYNIRA